MVDWEPSIGDYIYYENGFSVKKIRLGMKPKYLKTYTIEELLYISKTEKFINRLKTSDVKIKLAGSCGFLKSTWDETYGILCEEGKSAFSTLGISTMLLAVAGLFIGIALLFVNRRCGGHGPIAAPEDNTKISPEDGYDY